MKDGFLHVTFPALGTTNDVQFRAPGEREAGAFLEDMFVWLAAFEARYSRFIPDSLISRINDAAGLHAVDVDGADEELFGLCDYHHARTRGAFDPTLGPLVLLWSGDRLSTRPPTPEEIATARALVGWRKVVRDNATIFLPQRGMSLDLGGIGKEWAVDQVCHLAARHDIHRYAVSFGRDIRVAGEPPEGGRWRLGLEHPGDPERCWDGVLLRDSALCCSGDYRRFVDLAGRRLGHILDPRSGEPANSGCHAAWVIAPTCTDAGMLCTTALIVGADDALRRVEATPGASACLWLESEILETRRFHEHRISVEEKKA